MFTVMTSEAPAVATNNVAEFALYKRVAANVRIQMALRQVSQTALAAHLGVAQQSVSPKVRGMTPFTLTDIDALARWWGLEPAELLAAHPWSGSSPSRAVNSGWRSRLAKVASHQSPFVTPAPLSRVA